MRDENLVHYARKLLTPDQLDRIADVPAYGPNGLRRYLGGINIEAFAKLYFPEFTLPFPEYQLDMLADCQDVRSRAVAGRPGRKIARAIPRNHAKSTINSRILPIHGFLYNWSMLTVLFGNNDDASRRLVGNIKNEIDSNAAIQQDFPNIKGDVWGIERITNNAGAVITSFGVGSGAVRGISIGQYRPSLIILDDVDDDKSVRSAVELANNIEWFDKSISALGDNVRYTTSFIAVGTIIRKTSLMQYIVDSADYDSIILRRVVKEHSNDELWQQWQRQYLELARNNKQPRDASEDIFYQQHKEDMLAGTQVLWDKEDDYYYAQIYKLARGNKAFQSEMQNDPIDTDSILGNIPYISLSSINEREWQLLAALDPTIAGGKKNDLAAYVEALYNPQLKQVIISYVDAKQRTYGATIDAVARRIKARSKQYQGFWVEDNSAGLIIKDLLQERFSRDGIPLRANGVYNTLPKADRIGALSEYIERGQLLFADTLPKEATDELALYPMTHDDFLDACSIIILQLKERGLLDIITIGR